MKNYGLILNTFITLGATLSLTACVTDDLSDMHNKTVDLDNKTGQLLQTTTGLGSKTDDLDKKTGDLKKLTTDLDAKTNTLSTLTQDLYSQDRQGAALVIRQRALKEMEEAPSQEAKISAAGKYFQAFEFQLWTNYSTDTEAYRVNTLYLSAAQEFTRDLSRYTDFSMSASPTATDSNHMNLYALAVTMHEVNGNIAVQDLQDHMDDVSMLALVKGSCTFLSTGTAGPTCIQQGVLSMVRDVNDGVIPASDVQAYQQEMLDHEEVLTYMLRLRANFLPAMVLGKISSVQDTGFLGIPGLVRELGMLLGSWNSEIPSLNVQAIRDYTGWLNESNTIRDYLLSIGKDPQMDGNLHQIFQHMKFPTAQLVSHATPEQTGDYNQYSQALSNLNSSLNNYLGEGKTSASPEQAYQNDLTELHSKTATIKQ